MKVIIDNKLYIQKKDMIFLYNSNLEYPRSLFFKVNKEHKSIDIDNEREFILIEDLFEIEYLKKLEWIYDYNYLINLSSEELLLLKLNIEEIRKKYINKATIDKNYTKEVFKELYKYDYKLSTINEILFIKQGLINIELPNTIQEINSENILKKLIKKIKNK